MPGAAIRPRVWLACEGQVQGLSVDGRGRIGGVLALQDTAKPFSVEVKAAVGQTKASAAGTLTNPMHLGALDLRLTLSGASMADLYPLIGRRPAGHRRRYSTDGHLIGRLNAHARRGLRVPRLQRQGGRRRHTRGPDLHQQQAAATVARRSSPRLLLRFADLGPLVGADTGKEAAASRRRTAPRWRRAVTGIRPGRRPERQGAVGPAAG